MKEKKPEFVQRTIDVALDAFPEWCVGKTEVEIFDLACLHWHVIRQYLLARYMDYAE